MTTPDWLLEEEYEREREQGCHANSDPRPSASDSEVVGGSRGGGGSARQRKGGAVPPSHGSDRLTDVYRVGRQREQADEIRRVAD